MSPALLRETGEALFGQRWRAELARAIDVDERTVRRWENGSFNIPPGVWIDIGSLIRERRKILADLTRRLA